MPYRLLRWTILLAALSCPLSAQVLRFPDPTNALGNAVNLDAIQATQMDFTFFTIDSRNPATSPLQEANGAVSPLDLKAPAKARHEFQKGYQLLMGKDLAGAVEHLEQSLVLYPKFVAAHNALGTAYLDMNQGEKAKKEFLQATALDEHLPNSFLNLGCAHLALKDYAGAEGAFQKASAIAPLDLQLLTAKAYGEFVNRDYPAVISTAKAVHERKHQGAALVHYFAAGAWEARGDLSQARREMELLLKEDPKSPSAAEFSRTLNDLKNEQVRRTEATLRPVSQNVTFEFGAAAAPTSDEASREAQRILQNLKEENEVAEAEAAEPNADASANDAKRPADAAPPTDERDLVKRLGVNGPVFRSAVDEVSIFFAATDHGKSVTDLSSANVGLRDDSRPPESIRGFRNVSQLPLRLGLVIDTSNSVTDRFSFEQAAASKFLERVVTAKDDLAFVVGVNNSVLLVQDFTADQAQAAHAVNQLAPGGGTALWDAISFASGKLSSHPETQPVARVLVVISDGEDNSSDMTLKQAIAAAQRGEVAIYTVSTRDTFLEADSSLVADHALKALSELTGGANFVPGSVKRLNGSLDELQQVIRGRYLVSYKPASFQRDGRYRTVKITAQKDGHPLKVYARKGYYAGAAQAPAQ